LKKIQVAEEIEERKAPLPYERKFGFFQRLHGVIFRPNETFNDIALSPDYGGVIFIMLVVTIVGAFNLYQILSKIQFVGQHAGVVRSMVNLIMGLISVLAFFIFVARWLIKSVIVWKICDSGSKWKFSSAASVTGYSYIADFVSAIISIFFVGMLPTLTLDTSNIEAATAQANEYIAKLMGYQPYFLILSLVFIVWKSYMGGLGTHYGTKGLCSKAFATAIFITLSLIGLAVNYLLQLW
jgi:hypothetical protein